MLWIRTNPNPPEPFMKAMILILSLALSSFAQAAPLGAERPAGSLPPGLHFQETILTTAAAFIHERGHGQEAIRAYPLSGGPGRTLVEIQGQALKIAGGQELDLKIFENEALSIYTFTLDKSAPLLYFLVGSAESMGTDSNPFGNVGTTHKSRPDRLFRLDLNSLALNELAQFHTDPFDHGTLQVDGPHLLLERSGALYLYDLNSSWLKEEALLRNEEGQDLRLGQASILGGQALVHLSSFSGKPGNLLLIDLRSRQVRREFSVDYSWGICLFALTGEDSAALQDADGLYALDLRSGQKAKIAAQKNRGLNFDPASSTLFYMREKNFFARPL